MTLVLSDLSCIKVKAAFIVSASVEWHIWLPFHTGSCYAIQYTGGWILTPTTGKKKEQPQLWIELKLGVGRIRCLFMNHVSFACFLCLLVPNPFFAFFPNFKVYQKIINTINTYSLTFLKLFWKIKAKVKATDKVLITKKNN